jgi:hypothetical protein
MGKQRKTFNIDEALATTKQIGQELPDYGSQQGSILSSTARNDDLSQLEGYDKPVVLGKFGANQYIDARANEQTWAGKALRGIKNALVTAGAEIAKMPGYGVGAVMDIFDETKGMDKALNNMWLRGVDKVSDHLHNDWFAIHKPSDFEDRSLLEQLGSMEFWATEGADGVGFLVSFLAPGMLIKGLKAGAGTAKFVTKTATKLPGKMGTAINPKTLGANLDSIYSVAANTVLESTAEASGTFNQALELAKQQGYEGQQAREMAAEKAATVFNANMLLLAATNVGVERMLFKGFNRVMPMEKTFKKVTPKLSARVSKANRKMSKDVITGAKDLSPMTLKTTARFAATRVPGAMVSEGFIEEGSQSVIEQVAMDEERALNRTTFADTYIENLSTMFSQNASHDAKAFGKGVFLGGAIGGVMGIISAEGDRRQTNRKLFGQTAYTPNKWGRAIGLRERKESTGLYNLFRNAYTNNAKNKKELFELDENGEIKAMKPEFSSHITEEAGMEILNNYFDDLVIYHKGDVEAAKTELKKSVEKAGAPKSVVDQIAKYTDKLDTEEAVNAAKHRRDVHYFMPFYNQEGGIDLLMEVLPDQVDSIAERYEENVGIPMPEQKKRELLDELKSKAQRYHKAFQQAHKTQNSVYINADPFASMTDEKDAEYRANKFELFQHIMFDNKFETLANELYYEERIKAIDTKISEIVQKGEELEGVGLNNLKSEAKDETDRYTEKDLVRNLPDEDKLRYTTLQAVKNIMAANKKNERDKYNQLTNPKDNQKIWEDYISANNEADEVMNKRDEAMQAKITSLEDDILDKGYEEETSEIYFEDNEGNVYTMKEDLQLVDSEGNIEQFDDISDFVAEKPLLKVIPRSEMEARLAAEEAKVNQEQADKQRADLLDHIAEMEKAMEAIDNKATKTEIRRLKTELDKLDLAKQTENGVNNVKLQDLKANVTKRAIQTEIEAINKAIQLVNEYVAMPGFPTDQTDKYSNYIQESTERVNNLQKVIGAITAFNKDGKHYIFTSQALKVRAIVDPNPDEFIADNRAKTTFIGDMVQEANDKGVPFENHASAFADSIISGFSPQQEIEFSAIKDQTVTTNEANKLMTKTINNTLDVVNENLGEKPVAKVNTAPDKSEIVITPEEPDTTPPPPPTPEPPKATAIVDSSKNGAKPADLYHTSGRSIEQDAKDGGDVVSGIVYPIISSNEYEEAWFEFTDKITPEELDKYNVQLVVANYKSGEPIQRAIARSNPNKRSSSDVFAVLVNKENNEPVYNERGVPLFSKIRSTESMFPSGSEPEISEWHLVNLMLEDLVFTEISREQLKSSKPIESILSVDQISIIEGVLNVPGLGKKGTDALIRQSQIWGRATYDKFINDIVRHAKNNPQTKMISSITGVSRGFPTVVYDANNPKMPMAFNPLQTLQDRGVKVVDGIPSGFKLNTVKHDGTILENGTVLDGYTPGATVMSITSTNQTLQLTTQRVNDQDIVTILNLLHAAGVNPTKGLNLHVGDVPNIMNGTIKQLQASGEPLEWGNNDAPKQLPIFPSATEQFSLITMLINFGRKNKKVKGKNTRTNYDIFLQKGRVEFGKNGSLSLKDVLNPEKNQDLIKFLQTKNFNVHRSLLNQIGKGYKHLHPFIENGKLQFKEYDSYAEFLFNEGKLTTTANNLVEKQGLPKFAQRNVSFSYPEFVGGQSLSEQLEGAPKDIDELLPPLETKQEEQSEMAKVEKLIRSNMPTKGDFDYTSVVFHPKMKGIFQGLINDTLEKMVKEGSLFKLNAGIYTFDPNHENLQPEKPKASDDIDMSIFTKAKKARVSKNKKTTKSSVIDPSLTAEGIYEVKKNLLPDIFDLRRIVKINEQGDIVFTYENKYKGFDDANMNATEKWSPTSINKLEDIFTDYTLVYDMPVRLNGSVYYNKIIYAKDSNKLYVEGEIYNDVTNKREAFTGELIPPKAAADKRINYTQTINSLLDNGVIQKQCK